MGQPIGGSKMIVSASQGPQTLELFRLVLDLISKQEPNIPTPLKEHFNSVIAQAKQLAESPDSVKESILPESVDLALEIRSAGDFAKSIKNIDSLDKITPALASKLLKGMETHSVY